MGKPAWEAMVVAEMEQHLPAARLFGTNSMNPDIEGAPWIVRPRENTTRPVDRGSVCDLRQRLASACSGAAHSPPPLPTALAPALRLRFSLYLIS